MTASLYQSASSVSDPVSAGGSTAAVWASFIGELALDVIVEIMLGAQVPPQPEEVGWQALGVEHHVVARSAPLVGLVTQQVVHLVRTLGIELQRFKIEIDPAGLRMVRIEVHDHQNGVVRRFIALRVSDELIVVDRTELQGSVGLQRRMLAAHA